MPEINRAIPKKKNMKRFILLLFLIVTLSSCGTNARECYDSVQEKYPTAQVINIPGSDYRFFVLLKNGDIFYVETMNLTNTKITMDYFVNRHLIK